MENQNTENLDSLNEEQVAEQQPNETADERDARIAELESTNRQLFERAKKAEGFVKVDGKWVKAPKAEEAVRAIEKAEATTGELSDAQRDFLELKGFETEEEQDVFINIMKRTGMSHREVIKDEYALSKINALREAKKTQAAIPGSTRRSGQAETDSVDVWNAKIDAGSAKLSDIKDFDLRQKVHDFRLARAQDETIPPWRR